MDEQREAARRVRELEVAVQGLLAALDGLTRYEGSPAALRDLSVARLKARRLLDARSS